MNISIILILTIHILMLVEGATRGGVGGASISWEKKGFPAQCPPGSYHKVSAILLFYSYRSPNSKVTAVMEPGRK